MNNKKVIPPLREMTDHEALYASSAKTETAKAINYCLHMMRRYLQGGDVKVVYTLDECYRTVNGYTFKNWKDEQQSMKCTPCYILERDAHSLGLGWSEEQNRTYDTHMVFCKLERVLQHVVKELEKEMMNNADISK